MLFSAVVDASCICSPLQKVAARPSVEVCAEMFSFFLLKHQLLGQIMGKRGNKIAL